MTIGWTWILYTLCYSDCYNTYTNMLYNNVAGRIQPQSIRRIDFGGGDLTSYMASLLASQGYSFTTPGEVLILLALLV
ncbi:hypothetical protein EB796_000098 [Bugula neritina]|uniref:Uncharacterized protein n=1 Tax=Bugula neritina TaxID=10212 RepID=A0A7J7KU22_BUGNE|nr:hypothetical protein EB796_000098 [Bugula neritina]